MPIPSSADRYETHIDRLIRESVERGDFEDLTGQGKPIPGAGTVDDDLWWVRRWLRRNLESGDIDRGSDPDSPQAPSKSS